MSLDDPIWGPGGPPSRRPKLSVVQDDQPPLVLRRARLRDPRTIPPRQWLYGTQLIRGFVTVLVAPGGTGKSAYAMGVAACIVSGDKKLGEHIFASVPTLVLNLEDPLDELDRRIAALMLRHNFGDVNLEGLYLHSGEDRAITMAAVGEDGYTIVYPDEEALTAQILEHHIGLVVVDPFAESHTLEENNNPHMVKAAAAWRRVARATNCAVLLVHHVRKGTAIDIDAARGAKALTDSARVGLLLTSMSEDDGKTLGIPEPDRWQYVRLDDAKVNMAPKASKARWFKLDQVELGNVTDDYPNGDKVAAIAHWEPPPVFAGQTAADLNTVLDRIGAGPTPGVLYAAKRGRSGERWAGSVLVEELGIGEEQAASMLHAWLKSRLLVENSYYDESQRKDRKGVTVDNTKRPTE